jgi:protein-L-isoaspartate(D-aspartate) O-methyltransferase
VIVLTGSTPVLPEAFQKSLRAGGRLFAVVGDVPVMQAMIVNCLTQEKEGTLGAYNTVGLFETCITPLRNAEQPARFTF